MPTVIKSGLYVRPEVLINLADTFRDGWIYLE